MAPRRSLITGITGQDGSYLAELLLEKGYEVHGVTRKTCASSTARIDHLCHESQGSDNRVLLHQGDLTDTERIRHLVLEIEPDEIYNLGAQSSVADSFDHPLYSADVDALGTLRMLESAQQLNRKKDVRFFQASTSEMFGQVRETPQTETTPFNPRSPYACAKVFGHHQVANYRDAHGLFACNGILFNHESPRRGEHFVTRKITRAATRIRESLQSHLCLGNIYAKRDWGHAKDYVRAMWLMLQQETPDDYVIATGETHSIEEFLELAFRKLDLSWQEFVRIDDRYARPIDVELLSGDASKLRDKLGWKPETLFEGLVTSMINADWELARRERTMASRHAA